MSMKRWNILLSLLLMLCMIPTAVLAEAELSGYDPEHGYTYVTLGRYPQTIDGGEIPGSCWKWGRHVIKDASDLSITPEPILWRVLTVDEEKAYLLSEYILFAHPMHVNYTEYKTLGKDYSKTDLCAYLNGEFAQTAFTSEELSMLLPKGDWGKVFIPTADDVKNKAIGMGNGEGMKAWATEYAIRVTGSYVFSVGTGAQSPYWVAEQSTTDARHGRFTNYKGRLGHIISDRENISPRPALYLDMHSFAIAGGTGTKVDPYVLVRGAAQ